MGKRKKIFLGLLVNLALCSCIAFLFILSFGSFLNSYSAITTRVLLAEVKISEEKSDDQGRYADVEIKLANNPPALAYVLGQPPKEQKTTMGDSQYYKVYGDSVNITASIISFRQDAKFNLEGTYKISTLYGKYFSNTGISEGSKYELNGGLGEWKKIYSDIHNNNITAKFYKLFINNLTLNTSGVFIADSPKLYSVFLTKNGFNWEID